MINPCNLFVFAPCQMGHVDGGIFCVHSTPCSFIIANLEISVFILRMNWDFARLQWTWLRGGLNVEFSLLNRWWFLAGVVNNWSLMVHWSLMIVDRWRCVDHWWSIDYLSADEWSLIECWFRSSLHPLMRTWLHFTIAVWLMSLTEPCRVELCDVNCYYMAQWIKADMCCVYVEVHRHAEVEISVLMIFFDNTW